MKTILNNLNSQNIKHIIESSHVRDLIQSIFSRVIAMLSSLVCSILITRSLNLDDRGQLSFILATVSLYVVFSNLGTINGNTYYASKEPSNCPKLLVNSIWFASIILLITLITISILHYYNFIKSYSLFELIIISFSVFANLSILLFRNILIGVNLVKRVNVVESVIKIISLTVITGLFINNNISLHICIIYYLTEPLLMLSAFTILQRKWLNNLTFDFTYFKQNLNYGFRIYVLSILGFLIMKADIFFIKRLLDNKQLGVYATSALVVENLGFIATVMSSLLLPRLIKIENLQQRFLVNRRQTIIISVLLFCIYTIAFIFAEQILIVFIKSNAYLGVAVFRYLLIANFFLSIQSVNVQFLNSIGVPNRLVFYWFLASISNIILNFFLIKKLGIEGAAIFSIISYFIIYVFVFFENKYQLKLHHDKN